REMTIGPSEIMGLRLLSGPEDPECEEAEQVRDEARTERHHRGPEVLIGADDARIGDADLEDDEGHRDREHTVRERRDAFEATRRDLVVREGHLNGWPNRSRCATSPSGFRFFFPRPSFASG